MTFPLLEMLELFELLEPLEPSGLQTCQDCPHVGLDDGQQMAISGSGPSDCGSIAGQPLVVYPTLAGVVVFPRTSPRHPASQAVGEGALPGWRLTHDGCLPSSPAQGRRQLPGCVVLLLLLLLGVGVCLLKKLLSPSQRGGDGEKASTGWQ